MRETRKKIKVIKIIKRSKPLQNNNDSTQLNSHNIKDKMQNKDKIQEWH